jgi:hypothetical protein
MGWIQSIPGVGVRRVYRCRYDGLLIADVPVCGQPLRPEDYTGRVAFCHVPSPVTYTIQLQEVFQPWFSMNGWSYRRTDD